MPGIVAIVLASSRSIAVARSPVDIGAKGREGGRGTDAGVTSKSSKNSRSR